MERIAKTGSVAHAEVPAKWQKVFVTANQIAPEWHIKMQAAFQEHCDSAISKTTNFAHAATIDDVRKIYEMAYDMDCKGVTVYRDGSRDNQVLSTGATDAAAKARDTAAAPRREEDRAAIAELRGAIAEKDAEIERLKKQLYEVEAENLQRRAKRSRPDKLRGTTIRKETPLGTMFVNITEDEKGQPFEVFLMLGKAGGSAMADAEAMGRLISLALRSGIPVSAIHKQLRGISSDRAVGLGPNKVLSVPDAIGIAIEEWHRDRVDRRAAGAVAEQSDADVGWWVVAEQRHGDVDDASGAGCSSVDGIGGWGDGATVWACSFGGSVHRHVPGLRVADGVRGGMCEVSCVWV